MGMFKDGNRIKEENKENERIKRIRKIFRRVNSFLPLISYPKESIKIRRKFGLEIKLKDLLKYSVYLSVFSALIGIKTKTLKRMCKWYALADAYDDILDVKGEENFHKIFLEEILNGEENKRVREAFIDFIREESKDQKNYYEEVGRVVKSTFPLCNAFLEEIGRKELKRGFFYGVVSINLCDCVVDYEEDKLNNSKNTILFLEDKGLSREKALDKVMLTIESSINLINYRPLKIMASLYYFRASIKAKKLKTNKV